MAEYNELGDRIEAHRKAVEVAERLLNESQSRQETPARKELLIGLALYQLQEYSAAYQHLSSSFSLEGNSETAARLAVSTWRTGNLEEAQQWIKQAIAMNPKGSIETLIAETKPTYLAIFSQIQLASGHVDTAIATARAALDVDPNDISALHVLSNAHLIKGDTSAASEALNKAIQNAPPFISRRLEKERNTVNALVEANINIHPFATGIDGVQRVII